MNVALHKQRGASLLMATVFLLLVVALFGLIGLRLAGTDITDTSLQNDSVEALFLAESGLERAMQLLSAGTACDTLTDTVQNLGRGDFHIEEAIPVGSLCRVQVRGRVLLGGVMSAQRVIEGDLALAATSGWALGNNGTTLTWDGSTWTASTSGITRDINGATCIDASTCWAVADDGTIVRWNGSAWSSVSSSTSRDLNGVACVDANTCWAVGSNGTIVRWNGGSWSAITPRPTSHELQSVSCTDVNNCWAVGQNGVMLQWNGTNWTTVASPTTRRLNAIFFPAGTGGSSGLRAWREIIL